MSEKKEPTNKMSADSARKMSFIIYVIISQ